MNPLLMLSSLTDGFTEKKLLFKSYRNSMIRLDRSRAILKFKMPVNRPRSASLIISGLILAA